nr:tetratricopeptide repeat protein [Sphingomonas tagetis]
MFACLVMIVLSAVPAAAERRQPSAALAAAMNGREPQAALALARTELRLCRAEAKAGDDCFALLWQNFFAHRWAGQVDAGIQYLKEALAIAEAGRATRQEHWQLLAQIGVELEDLERRADAEPYWRAVVALMTGDPREDIYRLLLAENLRTQGKFLLAEGEVARAALALQRSPAATPGRIASIHNLRALILDGQQRWAEAAIEFRLALAIRRADPQTKSNIVGRTYVNLLGPLLKLKRYDDAEQAVKEALALDVTDDPALIVQLVLLDAPLAEARADWARAERAYRRALELQLAISRTSTATANVYHGLGSFLIERGRFAEGEPFQRSAYRIYRSRLSADHPRRLAITIWLAGCLLRLDRAADARTLFREAGRGFDTRVGDVRLAGTGSEAADRRRIFFGQVKTAWRVSVPSPRAIS